MTSQVLQTANNVAVTKPRQGQAAQLLFNLTLEWELVVSARHGGFSASDAVIALQCSNTTLCTGSCVTNNKKNKKKSMSMTEKDNMFEAGKPQVNQVSCAQM